jgi:predicted Zn-dependent protease
MPTYDQDIFHFGFVLGADLSYVTIRPIADLTTHNFDSTFIPDILPLPDSAKVLSVTSTPAPGFVISIVSNMRLGDNFDLRFIPSLTFGDRDLIYVIKTYRKESESQMIISKKVPSTYVNFPLELKFKSDRYNNFRAYMMGGVQYTIDLASQAKKREQHNADQKIVKFNQNDVYLEAGVGFDFYNEWFKLGLEVKMMYGLFDQLKREDNLYTNSIQSLKSKIFQFSVTFE